MGDWTNDPMIGSYLMLHLTNLLLSVITDYLLGKSNLTMDFDCLPTVTTAQLISFTDMDSNVVIPLFKVRSGIDQIVSS